MKYTSLLVLILLCSCNSKHPSSIDNFLEENKVNFIKIKSFELKSINKIYGFEKVNDVFFVSDGKGVYVLDDGFKTIHTLTDSTGFNMPLNISTAGTDKILVRDVKGRCVIFNSKDYSYVTSFVTPNVIPINSDIKWVSDSLIVAGGQLVIDNDRSNKLLHYLDENKNIRKGLISISEKSIEMEESISRGVHFSVLNDTLYAIQPYENKIYEIPIYDRKAAGYSWIFAAKDYTPLWYKQPYIKEEIDIWYDSWDKMKRIFNINNNLIVVSCENKKSSKHNKKRSIYILDKKIKKTIAFLATDEYLIYANTINSQIYTFEKQADKNFIHLYQVVKSKT